MQHNQATRPHSERGKPMHSIAKEDVVVLKDSADVMLRSSAEINNAITTIQRTCPYADDPVIIAAIRGLQDVSVNLSGIWAELDLTLASNDML